ncbi:MAG TPA: 8-oxo-dGTP diphosphatase [Candidatus Nanoarchaeia archaeon]|nr:8-oxo-dGTP diphosphatase [Candidatus Nanoarchaeia archaeon]
MEKYAKIISTCCYVRDKGKILFLHRNKKEGLNNKQFFRGLGGKAEQGESPIDCVIREVKEEAGININPIWKGVVTFSRPSDVDWEAHIFISEGFEGELMENSPEGKLVWVDENETQNLEMPEADKKLLPLLFQDKKFHAHAKYDDYKNLISLKVDEI